MEHSGLLLTNFTVKTYKLNYKKPLRVLLFRLSIHVKGYSMHYGQAWNKKVNSLCLESHFYYTANFYRPITVQL